MCGGRVVPDRHARSARRTVRAREPGFPEANDAAPKLDHGLRHHQAAALIAFHCQFPPCLSRTDSRRLIEQIKNINQAATNWITGSGRIRG
jgi:hypothetical protein